ncbi:Subunit of heteropentameric Replication factor C (RF-C) [Polyrhizophydium stewartii]|uniref:Subunit of heteropentameric Replication factor C (RF-C) n=1 Tax=Polyrhizophydium stewartii TaxID=2732419 RepID=A0ABR4NFA4_9FUNG|nr:hypothetical protein HK105_008033 [Polyrhizophydium stewartii]
MSDDGPWTERYRPRSLAQVSAQEDAVAVLSRTLSGQSLNLPHMLFYGPPGTGKTSMILALARELYGPAGLKGRLLELNASDERGIDVIREKVKTFAKVAVSANPAAGPPFKIIVLDEADSMTADAQSALRRIMENYSKITRFCLICNYVSRIIDPLASRCAKIRFKPIPMPSVIDRLEFICTSEGLAFDPDALEFLASTSGGDLRRAITLLQSIRRTSLNARVTKQAVAEISGIIPDDVMDGVTRAWTSKDVEALEAQVRSLVRMGHSAVQFIQQFSDRLAADPHLADRQKSRVALMLGQTDRALVDGADEHLQMLKVLISTMVY